MSIFALQFDDCCVQFDSFEDANIVEPYMGQHFRIAVCDLTTSVEGAFAHFGI